jgi:hypothetical protein
MDATDLTVELQRFVSAGEETTHLYCNVDPIKSNTKVIARFYYQLTGSYSS